MAYLDIALASKSRSLTSKAAQPALLSRIEREIVLASRGDHAASAAAERRLIRLFRWLFGFPSKRGLANARLETLRRYAVLYRLNRATINSSDLDRLYAAGYTPDQAALIRLLIDRMPRPRGHSRRWWFKAAIALVTMAVFVGVGAAVLAQYLDDDLIGLILIGACVATAGPFFAAASRRRPSG